MPAELEVNAIADGVDFRVEDDNGERVQFKLDRRMASALVVMGRQELSRLPPPEGELLQDPERPLLEGRPSFQVAIDHQSGDVVFGFRLHPLSAKGAGSWADPLLSNLRCFARSHLAS